MKKAAFVGSSPEAIDRVYAMGRRERIAALAELLPDTITPANFGERRDDLGEIEAIFSTWGLWPFSEEQMAALPALGAVFYAAGSVRGFAPPFLDRGVVLVSGWGANAVAVAEFVLAQILLSCKGYFRNAQDSKDPVRRRANACFRGRGTFGETVAIVGVGQIGRTLIRLLQPFDLEVLACDPRLTGPEASALGVRKVSVEEAFAEARIITNHVADLPSTRGMLHAGLFERMRPDATFINTGRGAQVVEEDLVRIFSERPDLTALLDVTEPEPPTEGSRLYDLPNIHLSSHIAGAIGDEVVRMADAMIEEFERWRDGDPLQYQVTCDMLDWMA